MSNVFEFLKFPPLRLSDKVRLGWTILYASKIKSWHRLEAISVKDWLTRHSGGRTFEKIWLPLLKSKLGENYQIANAAFIWAIIARMYGARRSGFKQEMFGYVDGGYERILRRFQSHLERLGVEILLECQASGIQNNGAGVTLLQDGGRTWQFDCSVLTIPSAKISRLCPGLSLAEQNRLLNIAYEGVLCLSLILRKPLAGYYITNITDNRIPFTAVIDMTAFVDHSNFDGNALVYLPVYLTHDDPCWQRNDRKIEEQFLSALESIYSTFKREDILASKVSRAKHVLPITSINYSKDLLPPTRTSLEKVFVVNSAQIPNGTMNVNEIVGLANRKAKKIASYLRA
jgi:protoporphyrinogen oxidase